MASYKRYSVNTPPDLAELIDQRIPECPYDSASSYFLGLAIFDLWSRREHRYTAKLMAQPLAVRDKAFAELARKFKEERHGAKEPGWFDHFVREIVERELKAKENPELNL